MKIWPLETKVKFKTDTNEYNGIISSISIRRKYFVEYQITYWKNDEPKSIWLTKNEFKVGKNKKKKLLGFYQEEPIETEEEIDK